MSDPEGKSPIPNMCQIGTTNPTLVRLKVKKSVVKQKIIYFLTPFYKREEFPVEHNQPGFSAKSFISLHWRL